MSTVLDRLMRQSHCSGQLMHLNSSDFGFEVMVMRYSWREIDETGSQKWHIGFKSKQYQFWKHMSQVRLMSTVAERPMRWGPISGTEVLSSTHSENRQAQLQTNWWGCCPESQQWHSGFTFKQYPFWKQKSTAADKLTRLLESQQWHSQCLLSYSIDSNTQVTVSVENSCKIVLAPRVTAQWLEWVTSTQWHQ